MIQSFAPGSLDLSPDAIGGLFRKAHTTHIASVQFLIECGRLLKAKKDSLDHRGWLPWLEANREALGFGERAAQLLMKAATNSNPQLTSDLTPAEALRINRGIWGNEKKVARISRQSDPTREQPPLETSSKAANVEQQPPQIIGDGTEPDHEPGYALWTESDQQEETERLQLEHEVFLEQLKTAGDQRSVLYAEVERQKGEIATLRSSRDAYLNSSGEYVRLLKKEQGRTARLSSKITELQRQVEDRDAAIKKLQADNEALRERVAIMEESAT